jgi:small nuclear ribonucleoprotein (snRNP)-like protein
MQISLIRSKILFPVSLFILLASLCSSSLQAQQYKRVEIETQGNADDMVVVPIGNEGLILFSQVMPGKYNFAKYTTDLQQDWKVDCMVNSTLDLSKYVYNGKSLYLLFSRFKSPVYQVLKVNVKAGFAEKFEMHSLNKLEITDFEATGNDVFIAGKTRSEPILLHINLQTKQTQVMPTALKGKAEIQSLELDTVNQQLNVAFANWRGRDYKMVIKSFTPEGKQIKSVALDSDEERSLLTGRVSQLKENEDLVIGTYGTRGSSYANYSRGYYTRSVYMGNADYTQGLYISKLANNQPQFMKYYSFTDFKNFFKFMNGRQQERMERKIKKRKQAGKDLKLQYRLLVHDIIQHNGQYIMVAEAYYPEYRNTNNFYPGMNGYGYGYGGFGYNGYGRNYPIFDGWVYTHAVIAGFDMQGNLLWDNSFEINDVKTFSLREKVKVSFSNDNIVLAYSHSGMLKTKVIRGNDIVEGKEDVPLRAEFEGDKVKKSSIDNVDYWYQNNFLAWGYQKIRNQRDEQVKGKRNVFYFSKVEF